MGKRWLEIPLLFLMLILPALAQLPPTSTVKKQLGDINTDRIREVAVEKTSFGASSTSTSVSIYSGKSLVLGPINLSGDTADGYRMVKKQIVFWQGDWDTGTKWSPHYYDFTWYCWEPSLKKYRVVEEGKTKKAFSYQAAKKAMPVLAKQPRSDQFKVVSGPGSLPALQLGRAQRVAVIFLVAIKKNDLRAAGQVLDQSSGGTPLPILQKELRDHRRIVAKLPPIQDWLVAPSIYDVTWTVFCLERPSGYDWTIVVDNQFIISKFWCLAPGEPDWD